MRFCPLFYSLFNYRVAQRGWHACVSTPILMGALLVIAGMALPVLAAPEDPLTTTESLESTTAVDTSITANYDKRITVTRVEITGNRLVSTETITNVMSLRPSMVYSKKRLQEDLARIYALGYFTQQMKAKPRSTPDGVVVALQVEENAPITDVTLQGNTVLPKADVDAVFQPQLGMPQNLAKLNEGIAQLEALYRDKGYVLARITDVSPQANGTLNLTVEEGIIDDIQIVGNRKTKPYVIKRSLAIKKGIPYNETVMSDDLKRLFSMQSFEDVRRQLVPNPDVPDHYNVVIEVDEKRSAALNVGGGIDTVTGFFGSAGYSDPNFLGRGENFNVSVGVGSGVFNRDATTQANRRMYQFDAGWSTPSLGESNVGMGVNLFGREFASFNVPLTLERRVGLGVNVSKAFEDKPHWSGSLGFRTEFVEVQDVVSQATYQKLGITPALRQQQIDSGTFVSLTPSVAFDTRDNLFNPSQGWLNTVSISPTVGVGADSYITGTVNLRKYMKVGDNVVFAVNGQVSHTGLGDIPDFNAFRLGGAYSVRGYQEGGLGIGQGFALGSAELRVKPPLPAKLRKNTFFDSLRLVAFSDAGTLLDESDINRILGRRGDGVSAGAGIRLNIPALGALRFDYAIPLSGTRSDYRQSLMFGVGQKF
ncbi:MAG: outer membrane protein assembly factor [Vampirovibrionales bacterium]